MKKIDLKLTFSLIMVILTITYLNATPVLETNVGLKHVSESVDSTKYEAELFTTAEGARSESNEDLSGGGNIGFITNGTWTMYADFQANGTEFEIKVAASSSTNGGTVEVRRDSVGGDLLATIAIPGTSGWANYDEFGASLALEEGAFDLYLVFTSEEEGYLFNMDYFEIFRTESIRPAFTEIYEAELFDESEIAQAETNADLSGGGNVGFVKNGAWLKFADFYANGSEYKVSLAAASNGAGGAVEFRVGAVDGPVAGSIDVTEINGWSEYVDYSSAIALDSAVFDLYLVCVNDTAADAFLFNMDYFKIVSEIKVEAPVVQDDATLSQITVDGKDLALQADVFEFTLSLPFGTATVPTVVAVATEESSTVTITNAASLPGETVIDVVAGDGTTQLTYTIKFELLADLKSILFVGTTGNADDQVLIDSLKTMGAGYNVTLVDGGTFSSNYKEAASYEDYDLLFISESISSGNGNAYGEAGFPIPAFISEPYLLNKANIALGGVAASGQVEVLTKMDIVDGNHDMTKSVYASGDVVQVLADTVTSVYQYELSINAGVLYEVLGTPNIDESGDPTIYLGGPSWVLINENQIVSIEPYIEIPEGVEIVVHGFHSGSSTQGTAEYMKQVRRSVQYLLGDLPALTTGPLALDDAMSLEIFPNPTSDYAQIKFYAEQADAMSIRVLNLEGKALQTFTGHVAGKGEQVLRMDVADLAAGTYIVEVTIGENAFMKKLVKAQH